MREVSQLLAKHVADLRSVRYLYTLFVAMDGNFQLKGRDKAGSSTDEGTSTGMCIVLDNHERQQWCLNAPVVKQVITWFTQVLCIVLTSL